MVYHQSSWRLFLKWIMVIELVVTIGNWESWEAIRIYDCISSQKE